MSDHYILDGHKPVPCDLMTWARWFENTENRRVAGESVDGALVSTVFLGIDHAFGYGPPQLFETMILGGPHDGYQERCATWEQAEAMHRRALDVARSAPQLNDGHHG